MPTVLYYCASSEAIPYLNLKVLEFYMSFLMHHYLKDFLELNQKTSTCEVREGTTYESNAALCELKEEDIIEIPTPSSKPENNAMCLEDETEYTKIYFDIEATGLSRTSHATQISASRGEEMCSTNVLPSCEISSKAAEITGLTFQNGYLFFHNNIVPAVNIKASLIKFIQFLEKSEKNVIFGHNIFNYDCPVLYNALDNCYLL
ncbi:unnamed protein product [Mytilus coruscus]|uniref:Exonuclease domain-containing protein n=1 Tax=Mytilus coruscus TaxID=42192 RepID=A0A6J8DNL2_MYTCO|nr:unnamed protein product [Mytilus coruscus]